MSKRTRTRRTRLPPPLVCRQATTLVADYLSGDLDAETTSLFDRHVRGCRDCTAFLRSYHTTIDAIRSLRYVDIPPALQDRVLAILRQRAS